MNFLPPNYEIPETSNFMTLKDGDNEFLILDSASLGFEYWTVDNKPVRLAEKPKRQPDNIRYEKDDEGNLKPEKVKHFWAFPVWNVRSRSVQVLQITQKGIMGDLQTLARNEKWGDPIMSYTITITRSGSGRETEYTVIPNPKVEVPQELRDEWERVKADGFDLNRLFTGGDPFVRPLPAEGANSSLTPGL